MGQGNVNIFVVRPEMVAMCWLPEVRWETTMVSPPTLQLCRMRVRCVAVVVMVQCLVAARLQVVQHPDGSQITTTVRAR